MGRRSSIESKGNGIVEEVARLIRAGHTIEEIRAKLLELDVDVSRSAVGRHVKSQRKLMERYTAAQEVAGKLVARIGENPHGDVGALLAEMLKTIGFQMLDAQLDSEKPEEQYGPGDFHFLAKALDHLERANVTGYKRRKAVRDDALLEAAKSVEATGTELGIKQSTIDEITKRLKLL